MNTMFEGIKRFAREEDGAAGIEYALLLAFVALCMVTAGPLIKTAVTTIWTNIQTALTAAAWCGTHGPDSLCRWQGRSEHERKSQHP